MAYTLCVGAIAMRIDLQVEKVDGPSLLGIPNKTAGDHRPCFGYRRIETIHALLPGLNGDTDI